MPPQDGIQAEFYWKLCLVFTFSAITLGPPYDIVLYPITSEDIPIKKNIKPFLWLFFMRISWDSYGKFNGQIPWHSSLKQFSIIALTNIMFIEFSGGHIINDSNLYPNKLVNIYDHLWTSMMSPRFFLWIRCYPILVGLISPVLIVVFSPTIYSTFNINAISVNQTGSRATLQ